MAFNPFGWTRRLYLLALTGVLGTLLILCALPARAEDDDHRHLRPACLLVDTDAATDDFRAIAVLFPNRHLRAVVVTEGISSVSNGSTAVALLLAGGQSFAPVIQGLAAASPAVYDWLPDARKAAERLNNYLATAVPFAGNPDNLKLALLRALRGCERLEVIVLGPWTSFVQYGPMLRPLIHRVVASGRPLSENNPDNFNCVYDQTACEQADHLLHSFRHVSWVDLPGDGMSYAPTTQMVEQLAGAGLPALLRALLNADTSQWLGGTRLWDDTAALYLLEREKFKPVGAHYEPAVDEDKLRGELVKAINAGSSE
jgi:inosine-uridine nucleoside N-ribohydrolase